MSFFIKKSSRKFSMIRKPQEGLYVFIYGAPSDIFYNKQFSEKASLFQKTSREFLFFEDLPLSIFRRLTESVFFLGDILLKNLYIQKTSCGSFIKRSPSEGLLFSEDFQSFLFVFFQKTSRSYSMLVRPLRVLPFTEYIQRAVYFQ